MPTFESHDATTIHYEVSGDRDPVVLLHSLGFNATLWTKMGIAGALHDSGKSTIGMDARGHGRSDAPHDPQRYADNAIAKDVVCLLDHLGVEQVDVVAYSIGSQVGLRVAQADRRIR